MSERKLICVWIDKGC